MHPCTNAHPPPHPHLVACGTNLLQGPGGQEEVDVILISVKGRGAGLVEGGVEELLEAALDVQGGALHTPEVSRRGREREEMGRTEIGVSGKSGWSENKV
jgi:hypothetical protein